MAQMGRNCSPVGTRSNYAYFYLWDGIQDRVPFMLCLSLHAKAIRTLNFQLRNQRKSTNLGQRRNYP